MSETGGGGGGGDSRRSGKERTASSELLDLGDTSNPLLILGKGGAGTAGGASARGSNAGAPPGAAGPPKTFRCAPSALTSRLEAFLPQMKDANDKVEAEIARVSWLHA